ncbi:carboxylesterase family protein [Henriciella sp. AS95]|uniref:carboxylesterase/lipase family protein n=1 Tax=Henriciella sp. AS95 TaxID=3135782 RepID=UPI00316CFEA1
MLDRGHPSFCFLISVITLASLILAACASTPSGGQRAPAVETTSGTLSGVSFLDKGGEFLGVPFAAPPTGDSRWHSPAPPQPWQGTRPATAFAPACPQGEYTTAWYADLIAAFGGDSETAARPVGESEDCLYLNIWSPDLTPDEPLPVMVWIHGGAYKGGWSYEPNYLGDRLAERGVIVVSIAYRMGPFGYIGPDGRANFGLQDQIRALDWIQSNIAQFGGNAENVTVFGESAGASSIGTLIVSPAADGLFDKAIHQSGGFEFIETGTTATAAEAFDTLQAALGDEDAQSASWLTILEASNDVLSDYWFAPVTDGALLPQSPRQLLRAGQFNEVDIMIGTNADEWLMYIDPASADDALATWRDRLPDATGLIDALVETHGEVGALDRIETADQMRCPGRMLARALGGAGQNVYAYRFTRVRPAETDPPLGSYHGAEIPYVFGTHDDWLPTDEIDRAITETMMSAWVAFARTGSPQSAEAWPDYSDTGKLLEIGDTIGPASPLDDALCQHIDAFRRLEE